jgi:hypothetical protein
MKIEINVRAVWNKFDNRPEHLDRVSVTVRDWDKDYGDSIIRQHSANGALANFSTERDVYNYISETLDMFREEGIEIPDAIHYNVEHNTYQDFAPADFDII